MYPKTPCSLPFSLLLVLSFATTLVSCSASEGGGAMAKDAASSSGTAAPELSADQIRLARAVSELPAALAGRLESLADDPEFFDRIASVLVGDPYLRKLVDKGHSLPESYEPEDLVALRSGSSYSVSRSDLRLRAAAEASLSSMASAAKADGVTLVASSSYRSYAYQRTVYQRIVSELGQEAADRESARPGHSQHQLGLVVDFGSITDAFAGTAAGRWLVENAGRFGWSLSFPDGYEQVTGYRWESWHYRYVGTALAAFIEDYFGGIQQYALEFLNAWELAGNDSRS